MDETALTDQAAAAGDAWLASRDDVPEAWAPLLHSVFSIGWIQGRGAGGQEAIAILRRHTAQLLRAAGP